MAKHLINFQFAAKRTIYKKTQFVKEKWFLNILLFRQLNLKTRTTTLYTLKLTLEGFWLTQSLTNPFKKCMYTLHLQL